MVKSLRTVDYSLFRFAESVRVDRCKVRNTPRLLFLCGGPTAKNGPYRSLRDFFYRRLLKQEPALAKRMKLAEDINEWFERDKPFPDLLELENYLAHLADLTLLFVESAGSIAELGAFAASEPLRSKTLAILNTEYPAKNSFIADGPVLRIKNKNEELVLYYEWNPNKLGSAKTRAEFVDIARDLVTLLKKRDSRRPDQVTFDPGKPGHTLLLVADLVRIGGASSRSDIANALNVIGCTSAVEGLDHHLAILQSADFITKHLRSNQAFYVRRQSESFIRYAYKADAAMKDMARIQTAIRQSLDPLRRAVLRKSLFKGSSSV